MSLKHRAQARLDRARSRNRLLDHLIRTWEHYRRVRGDVEAGAVTYFAFLSFFPVLALAFFVVGYVARVYPSARDNLVSAITQVLPGLIGSRTGQISLDTITANASAIGLIGLVGVLYSGLNWVGSMSNALQAVFETPEKDEPGFVMAKARDLLALLLIGVTLIVAVAVSGGVHAASQTILDWVGLTSSLSWLLVIMGALVGLAANAVLFFAMFRLLATPAVSTRALWSGAWLGAVGFEALKQLSAFLLGSTKHQPAFQAFGIALILLVWINYFSRVVLYAAAWSYTAHAARLRNATPAAGSAQGNPAESAQSNPENPPSRREVTPRSDSEALAARVATARTTDPAVLARARQDFGPAVRAARADRRRTFAVGAAAGVAGAALVRRLVRRG